VSETGKMEHPSPRVIASGSVAISAHAKREIFPCDVILPLPEASGPRGLLLFSRSVCFFKALKRATPFGLGPKVTKTERSDFMNTIENKQQVNKPQVRTIAAASQGHTPGRAP